MNTAFQKPASRRIRLRLLRPDDAPAFFRHVTSDPETMRYVQWPVQRAVGEAIELVATFIAAIESGEKLYLVAEDADGALIAFASVKVADSTASIGFVVVSAQRRQGYATELITLITEAAFEHEMIQRVEGLCDIDNVASARAMMKAGFVKEEILVRQEIHPNVGPEPRDLVRYARAKGESKEAVE